MRHQAAIEHHHFHLALRVGDHRHLCDLAAGPRSSWNHGQRQSRIWDIPIALKRGNWFWIRRCDADNFGRINHAAATYGHDRFRAGALQALKAGRYIFIRGVRLHAIKNGCVNAVVSQADRNH